MNITVTFPAMAGMITVTDITTTVTDIMTTCIHCHHRQLRKKNLQNLWKTKTKAPVGSADSSAFSAAKMTPKNRSMSTNQSAVFSIQQLIKLVSLFFEVFQSFFDVIKTFVVPMNFCFIFVT